MRNTYLLVNYGDFIVQDSADNSNLQPYVQLLSTSNDTALLHNEFVNVRLNGDDTTYNQSLQAINTSGLKAPTDSSGQWERIIIIASVVGGLFVLFLIGMLTWCLCKRRKARAGRYAQLNEPAPLAATDGHMGMANSTPFASSRPYNPEQYQTAWEEQETHGGHRY